MEIERHLVTPVALEAFADANALVMEVRERTPQQIRAAGHRFYARFKDAEVKDGGCLRGVYGTGDTEKEAIRNYAFQISETTLVIHANSTSRRLLRTPVLQV